MKFMSDDLKRDVAFADKVWGAVLTVLAIVAAIAALVLACETVGHPVQYVPPRVYSDTTTPSWQLLRRWCDEPLPR